MSTATFLVVCDDCSHGWDQHLEKRGAVSGGCVMPDCWCAAPRVALSVADRMRYLREQNPDPLVSKVDNKRNVVVGHVVTQATPDESDYDPWVGVVVERWHTEDGEPGVTAVKFAKRGADVTVLPRRWKVDELRSELLPNPDPYACATAARMLHKAIGQRIKRSGHAEPLNDFERTLSNWARALDHASTPTGDET